MRAILAGASFAVGLCVALPTFAQQQPQSPTDTEILQLETKAAESRAEYYAILIRKQAITAKETADYWAAYIGEKKDGH